MGLPDRAARARRPRPRARRAPCGEDVPTPRALARKECEMTPKSRDRNIVRVRRVTGAIAGAALAACGPFAGLAASATQKAYSTTTAATTKKRAQATPAAATTTQATTT